jgi:hypothetical protein
MHPLCARKLPRVAKFHSCWGARASSRQRLVICVDLGSFTNPEVSRAGTRALGGARQNTEQRGNDQMRAHANTLLPPRSRRSLPVVTE